MVFTPNFGTGFEMGGGDVELIFGEGNYRDVFGDRVSQSNNSHTGSYALTFSGSSAWVQHEITDSDIYLSIWCNPQYNQTAEVICITDGDNLAVKTSASGNSVTWDAYVGASKVADGSIYVDDANYHMLSVRFHLADSGHVETMIDGLDDISYSGDTSQGGATTNQAMRLTGNDGIHFDDFVIGTGGWPGDWRFDGIVPNADTATEDWLLSTGADSYALIDETPPDDTDYIYTTTNNDQTIVDNEDWSHSEFTPQSATIWARAQKDSASGQQLKIIDSDGVNTNIGSVQDLLTSWGYIYKFRTTAPDGGAWTDTDVDNLQTGVEASI